MGNGKEEGDMVVRQEGASPVVVGSYGECRLSVAGDSVDAGARGPLVPWKREYLSYGTACRSNRSQRLKACRNVR